MQVLFRKFYVYQKKTPLRAFFLSFLGRLLLIDCFRDGVGDESHFLCRQGQFGVGKEHILLGIHRHKMYMHVIYLHTQYRHSDTFATSGSLDAIRHFLGEGHETLELLVREVEDIIRLRLRQFGYYECVSLDDGIDVQERIVLVVLRYFVAWNLTFDNTREDSHTIYDWTIYD